MFKRFRNRPVLFVLLGLGLGLLVGVGMMIGTLTALTSQSAVALTAPPTLLHARFAQRREPGDGHRDRSTMTSKDCSFSTT
jgi:hypothetical protein